MHIPLLSTTNSTITTSAIICAICLFQHFKCYFKRQIRLQEKLSTSTFIPNFPPKYLPYFAFHIIRCKFSIFSLNQHFELEGKVGPKRSHPVPHVVQHQWYEQIPSLYIYPGPHHAGRNKW